MNDFIIDPYTKDYTVSKGQYALTTDIRNNIYLSLTIRRGSWPFNPEFGSRLYLLEREKSVDRVAKKAKEYCDEALKWIIDKDRAESIEVTTELDKANSRLKCLIEAKSNGETITQTIFVKVR
ncbi:MAG: phage GP46 family protein [Deltaproteobacteria bacterium]|nr:phage GP46 family protein [Deltaproteobacteria bacterium]